MLGYGFSARSSRFAASRWRRLSSRAARRIPGRSLARRRIPIAMSDRNPRARLRARRRRRRRIQSTRAARSHPWTPRPRRRPSTPQCLWTLPAGPTSHSACRASPARNVRRTSASTSRRTALSAPKLARRPRTVPIPRSAATEWRFAKFSSPTAPTARAGGSARAAAAETGRASAPAKRRTRTECRSTRASAEGITGRRCALRSHHRSARRPRRDRGCRLRRGLRRFHRHGRGHRRPARLPRGRSARSPFVRRCTRSKARRMSRKGRTRRAWATGNSPA